MRAISVKQPWATLLAYGLKTIEVRRWESPLRGPVLIHAARKPDERPEARAALPPHLFAEAEQLGGFVGIGEVVECRTYFDPEMFREDQALHLNPPAWFEEPHLHGFVFAHTRPLVFHPWAGWVRFFPVPDEVVEELRIKSGD